MRVEAAGGIDIFADRAAFKSAKDRIVTADDVIRRAGPAYPPRKQARSAPASVDKLDYSTLEHAGKPHRGKTTDAEKETVRGNLAVINERLMSDGVRSAMDVRLNK